MCLREVDGDHFTYSWDPRTCNRSSGGSLTLSRTMIRYLVDRIWHVPAAVTIVPLLWSKVQWSGVSHDGEKGRCAKYEVSGQSRIYSCRRTSHVASTSELLTEDVVLVQSLRLAGPNRLCILARFQGKHIPKRPLGQYND